MTKESTKYALYVMQEYINGKEIQYYDPNYPELGWQNTISPTWNWNCLDYRVKLE